VRAALFTAAAMFAVLPGLPTDAETVVGGTVAVTTTALYLDADVDRHRPDKLHRRRGLGRAFADGAHGRRPGRSGPRGPRFIPKR
jgi:hypothetical protein